MKACRIDAYYDKIKEQSGLNPTVLNFYYDYFVKTIGRKPTLRELPKADSTNYLKNILNIQDNQVSNYDLLSFTNTTDIKEAQVKLNTDFNDRIIQIIPIDSKDSLIKIKPRVNKFSENLNNNTDRLNNLSFLNINNGEISIDEEEYINHIKKGIIFNNPNKVYTTLCSALSNFINVNKFNKISTDNFLIKEGLNNNNKNIKIAIDSENYLEVIKTKDLGLYSYQFKGEFTNSQQNELIQLFKQLLPSGACYFDLNNTNIIKGEKVGDNLYKNNIIPIYQKPYTGQSSIVSKEDISKIQNSFEEIVEPPIILDLLNKIRDTLGVKIVSVTSNLIQTDEELSKIPHIQNAKAFIYNGQIYINTDLATEDSQTHELLHILLGHYRTIQPEKYYDLIKQVSEYSSFQEIAKNYENRSQEDVFEEVFVHELANYLTGRNSSIQSLKQRDLYELQFSIYNVLDTIINGTESAETFKQLSPLNYSFNTLAKMLNSQPINAEDILINSANQRAFANLKENLFKSNQLKEIC